MSVGSVEYTGAFTLYLRCTLRSLHTCHFEPGTLRCLNSFPPALPLPVPVPLRLSMSSDVEVEVGLDLLDAPIHTRQQQPLAWPERQADAAPRALGRRVV